VFSKLSAGVFARGLVIASLLALPGCGRHGGGMPQMPPPEVGVVTIQTQPVTLDEELPGRTSPYEVSDVRPQVGGIVKARLFTEGANVKAGQVLYQIDPATYQAAYDQAKAQLASAQANVATAQAKADRYADLVKINAVSRQDFDDANAAARAAAAAVAQQKAAVEAARINLAYTRVTAPIGGRTGRSSFTQGALVTAGQTEALTTVQRLDPIYVDITQSAADLLRLRRELQSGQLTSAGSAGAAVRLKLIDGSDYPLPGTLQFTDVTVDQTTGAVTLRAVFPNPNGVLLPGMYVRAVLNQGVATQAILVPQQAVTRNQQGNPTVMVVDPSGKAQMRVLKTDRVVGDKWLVSSGLKAGDKVIVEGLLKVRPDMPVKAVPAGSATVLPSMPGG
jgi:membrane fusion protein (multidrug efflux system)